MADLRSLDAVFHPRSLAVIGASDDPLRIGGRPIAHALKYGFAGPVYPVNPSHATVQGLPAFGNIRDVRDPVDCAIVALPAALVPEALRDCAAQGVRGAILFSGGFAELGEAGVQAQAEAARIAREAGMRLLGPNCIGSFSLRRRTILSFLSSIEPVPGRGARIGLASQSGGYGAHILKLATLRGLDVDQLVTTGNEADIEVGEVIEWMAESDEVDVIVGYVEGARNRDRLLAGFAAAHRRRKPVVLLKVGATAAGAAAAASHTAALAGADAVYDAVLRDYGVYRAQSTEEVLDVAYALSAGKPLRPRKLCVVSLSGGAGVQIADYACAAGMALQPPPDATQEKLRQIVPFGSPANPVDVTAQVGNQPEIFESTLDLLAGAGYDAILSWLGPSLAHVRAGVPMREAVVRAAQARPDALHIVNAVAAPEQVAALEAAGCLVYEEPRRAVQALAALEHFQRAFAAPLPRPVEVSAMELLPERTAFDEVEAKRVLQRAGIPLLDERLARSAEEAEQAARGFGRPVAIKVVSPDIAHKSDVGGVALGVAPEAAAATVRRMAETVRARAPQAHIAGWLVSPMLEDGVECIVGVHADPLFGPVVMFGLGGVLVEAMGDVSFALAPLDEDGAMALVRRVKGHKLLAGFRGQPAADLPALASAIAALSRLAARNAGRLQSLEVNPLRVLPQGRGVVALDAVLNTR